MEGYEMHRKMKNEKGFVAVVIWLLTVGCMPVLAGESTLEEVTYAEMDLSVRFDNQTDSAVVEWYPGDADDIILFEIYGYDQRGQLSLVEALPGTHHSITIEQVSQSDLHEVDVSAFDSDGNELRRTSREEFIPRSADLDKNTLFDWQIPTRDTGQLGITLVTCDSQNFPFIYLTVLVTAGGDPIDSLTTGNFFVEEDGVYQADYFEVTPPGISGGVRMADIVFLIDNSGSMGPEIAGVKDNCEAFADDLAASEVDYRLGLIQFGQYANGGHPRMLGSGLTADVAEFKAWVGTMPADGGSEYGFEAIRYAIQNYNFRPGAQKVFIIITDEDSDDRDKTGTINLILANDVIVHCAVDCGEGTSNTDYCDATSVRGVSDGLLLSVTDPYDQILDDILDRIRNPYIVRYRTYNDVMDSVERLVRCTVDDGSTSDYVECTYLPGGSPIIRRTPNTIALHTSALVAGSSPVIAAEVTDGYEPFVQNVTLYVRTVASRTGYLSLDMVAQGQDVYAANIPAGMVQEPGLEYYLTATDGEVTASDPSTEPALNPYQLSVLENQAPRITHTPTTEWRQGRDLNLEIQAFDETYDVSELTVYYRHQGQFLWNVIDRTYVNDPETINETISILGSELDSPVIEYYIEVIDDLGISGIWPVRGADNPYVLNGEPRLHVLCVGMDYIGHGNDFDGKADAEAVHNILKTFNHYDAANPQPLILNPSQTGNKARLMQSLDDIENNLVPGDDFILYFSGHGGFPTSGNGDETPLWVSIGTWDIWNTNDEYLCLETPFWTWDVNLSDDDIIGNTWLGSEKWDNVDKLILIDSCHSGGFWGDNNQNDAGDLEKLPRCAIITAAPEWGPSVAWPGGRSLWTMLCLEPALAIGGTIEDIADYITELDLSQYAGQVFSLKEDPIILHPYGDSIIYDGTFPEIAVYKSEDFSMKLVPAITTYTLTASVVGGHGSITPGGGNYDEGTVVTLNASPNPGYRVKAWSGTDNDSSKLNSNSVMMNSDKNVTVTFEAIPQYSLTASVVGGHGTLSPVSGVYYEGKIVTLTTTPDSGYRVKAWSGTNDDSSTATTNTVTMMAARTVTVEFERDVYALTISVIGGNGTVDPNSGFYDAGTMIELTATPDQYYRVKAWHGTENDASTDTTNTVLMNAAKTVTVEFEIITYTLATGVEGGHGQISPAGGTYDAGTVIELTALPDQYYRVKAWTGTDDDASADTTNTVLMDSDKTVSAEYEIIPVTLAAQVTAGLGQISPAEGTYDAGSVVELTALPDPYYQVKAWYGADDDTSTATTNTIHMDTDKTVSVAFEPIPATLTVNRIGGGISPAVSVKPSLMGSVEQVTAEPIPPGYCVRAWHGTDDDTSREPNNTVFMDSDKDVSVELASIIDSDTVTIKAGKERGVDSMNISGSLHASMDEISNATAIYIRIWSDGGFTYEPEEPISFDPASSVKNGKYRYKHSIRKGEPGGISSFKFDLNKHTFSLVVKNLDFTGLCSPVLVDISFGDYVGLAQAGEDIINGTKYIPMAFMNSHADSLRVDKCTFKLGTKPGTDSLAIQGAIAVEDMSVDMASEDVEIRWGNYSVMLPTDDIYRMGMTQVYQYKKHKGSDSPVKAAIFDLGKSTFRIVIKKSSINAQGNPVDFNIQYGVFDETVTVPLTEKDSNMSVYP